MIIQSTHRGLIDGYWVINVRINWAIGSICKAGIISVGEGRPCFWPLILELTNVCSLLVREAKSREKIFNKSRWDIGADGIILNCQSQEKFEACEEWQAFSFLSASKKTHEKFFFLWRPDFEGIPVLSQSPEMENNNTRSHFPLHEQLWNVFLHAPFHVSFSNHHWWIAIIKQNKESEKYQVIYYTRYSLHHNYPIIARSSKMMTTKFSFFFFTLM